MCGDRKGAETTPVGVPAERDGVPMNRPQRYRLRSYMEKDQGREEVEGDIIAMVCADDFFHGHLGVVTEAPQPLCIDSE